MNLLTKLMTKFRVKDYKLQLKLKDKSFHPKGWLSQFLATEMIS
jgi:hypothetical protein